MNPVVVRGVKIGEGVPKICVPIVGRTKSEIMSESRSMEMLPVDIVEWRADWFENVFDTKEVLEVLKDLRHFLKEKPLLFTFRTKKEGGEQFIDPQTYAVLNEKVMQSGFVDLVDAELFSGDDIVKQIIARGHSCGVKIIVSNHEFQKTPEKDEMISRLCKMQKLGADILKIAVMPQGSADVLALLSATEEMHRKYAKQPIITMSMSGSGTISRLCGEVFGSAVTFGAAKKASAPGQIGVEELAQVLSLLHKSL